MLYLLIETPEFSAQRAKLLSDDEYRALQLHLLANPTSGSVIPGTAGVRKLRVAMRGKGTRGGGRVIYLARHRNGRIYLLACYAKARQADLTSKQRSALRFLAGQLT